MKNRLIWIILLSVLALLIFSGRLVDLGTDWLWFKALNYQIVFSVMLWTKLGLFFVFGLAFFVFLYGNLKLTGRFIPVRKDYTAENIIPLPGLPVITRSYQLLLVGLAAFFSFAAALAAVLHWREWLLIMHPTDFGVLDPVFGKDVSFYAFVLPFLEFLLGQGKFLVFISFAGCLAIYLVNGALTLRQTPLGLEFARGVKAHLFSLAALGIVLQGVGYRLNMYDLVFSDNGAAFGAGYTDVHANLPALGLALFAAVLLVLALIIGIFRRSLKLPIYALAVTAVVAVLAQVIFPVAIQKIVVEPNELQKEGEYISRNITHTRKAFGLDRISENSFPVSENLGMAAIKRNSATISNIRLWDHRPLLQTYKQLQEIRLYYDFADVDVDRYMLNGRYKQVMLSGREMAQNQLMPRAQTWVNKTLIFTHGYGLCLSPVDRVIGEGMPDLYVKDIPPVSRAGITVTRPEIYYGEKTDGEVIVRTNEREFDYPQGDQNQYCEYQGTGGIQLNSFLRRVLFAWKLHSFKMLVTGSIKSESRVMLYRQIKKRMEKLAPFLALDHDPYLVVSDEGRMFFIQDAYTTTDMYPYAHRVSWNYREINYVRNSVKVVVDAYNGSVDFYLMDEADPLIASYSKIFPGLFKPLDQMPQDLRRHLRYPEGLFQLQAHMLTLYHMTDHSVFYNKEDLWAIPDEIHYEREQPMEPYYIIVKLAGAEREEFILMLPFTPAKKDNMIAWLAARCDGEHYGELVLYKFPKDKLVYGPMQIEARVDQTPRISEQLTLWGQKGSQVIRGNLLVIPIEDSLLYVEPLYLKADRSEIPELKRVIVAYGNRLAMGTSLNAALSEVFGGGGYVFEDKEAEGGRVAPAMTSKQALEHLRRANEKMKRGDWAGFGKEWGEVRRILEEIGE